MQFYYHNQSVRFGVFHKYEESLRGAQITDDDDDDDNDDGDDDNGYDDHDDNDAYYDDDDDNKWKKERAEDLLQPDMFFFGVGHWGRTYAIKSNETTPR